MFISPVLSQQLRLWKPRDRCWLEGTAQLYTVRSSFQQTTNRREKSIILTFSIQVGKHRTKPKAWRSKKKTKTKGKRGGGERRYANSIKIDYLIVSITAQAFGKTPVVCVQ
jgi:hypothetical protein